MKIIKNSKQADVWKHWFLTEQAKKYKQLTGYEQKNEIESHRRDIKSALPSDIEWYEAKIEKSDTSRLYIISSDDWGDISRQSFLVSIVGKNLDTEFSNKR